MIRESIVHKKKLIGPESVPEIRTYSWPCLLTLAHWFVTKASIGGCTIFKYPFPYTGCLMTMQVMLVGVANDFFPEKFSPARQTCYTVEWVKVLRGGWGWPPPISVSIAPPDSVISHSRKVYTSHMKNQPNYSSHVLEKVYRAFVFMFTFPRCCCWWLNSCSPKRRLYRGGSSLSGHMSISSNSRTLLSLCPTG